MKTTLKAFPESIKQKGGLKLAAVSPDGSTLLLKPYDDDVFVTVAVRGGPKSGRILRLHLESDLFPAARDRFGNQGISGIGLVEHDGKLRIVACWWDDHADGPGLGVFDMEGEPIYVEYFLDRQQRAARAKTTSSSGSKRSPQGLLVSPNRTHVAFAIHDAKRDIRVDSVASLVAGAPKSVTCAVDEMDFAFDAEGRGIAYLTFSREETTLHRVDLASGKKTAVILANEALLPLALFGCGVWITGTGAIFDDAGTPAGKLPGEVRGAVRAADVIAVIGGDRSKEQLWLLDASTRELKTNVPLPGATKIMAASRASNVLVVGAPRAARVLAC